MTRRTIIAAVITALGLLITLLNLRDGLPVSFALLLGLLLLADGIIRFVLLSQDIAKPEPGEER